MGGLWDYKAPPPPDEYPADGKRTYNPADIGFTSGGGGAAWKYHGGIATDAPFSQIPEGRIGFNGIEPGKAGAELDAWDKLHKYAKMFFGDPSKAKAEAVLNHAYENFPHDRDLMNAVEITARGMGVRAPWDAASPGSGLSIHDPLRPR